MAQTAKFIDVTRSFLPINPNAFPEALSTSSQRESPEKAIPIMAYKGYNFLPTAYGYKSYFGINQKLDFNPLTARVDFIFNFQNAQYENILIALTDSGIWIKKGGVTGNWINSVPMVAENNPNMHYDWSFCIINNLLYCYRQGFGSYQKIESDLTDSIIATSIVPNFLNMVGQVGIFRANGRLAFWDTTGSVAWANLDNFADFVPSLETLAGNTTFTDVHGRVVVIKSHGSGFIIYATKSIVYITQNIENVYQWSPKVILSSCGVSYPRQVTEASPDTIHFAYTQEGIKKIDNGKEDTIITEVTDYLKEYSKPIYLRILQGRYLALEILDDDYIVGDIQLTEEVIPAINYVFPGATYPILNSVPSSNSVQSLCNSIAALNAGGFEQGQATVFAADKKPGTFYTPIWAAYLSNGMVANADDMQFGSSPCPAVDPYGIDAKLCPTGGAIKTTDLTQTDIGKQASTGAQAYVDGNWTITRFVQAQTAIWDRQDKALQAVVSKITNRAKYSTRSVDVSDTGCVSNGPTNNECLLGRFVTKFSSPKFGWSPCEFWLTRYAIGAADIIAVTSEINTCGDRRIVLGPGGWSSSRTSLGNYPSAAAAAAASGQGLGTALIDSDINLAYQYNLTGGDNLGGIVNASFIAVRSKTTGFSAYNKAVNAEIGPIADTAFCRITGWKYTKNDGTTGIAAAAICNSPSVYPSNGGSTKAGVGEVPISRKDGSLCGTPYIAPMLANVSGSGSSLYTWPAQIVTLPTANFLLQKGSIAPLYPIFSGGLVYDLELKKWGKYRLKYKQLLDYSPLNSSLNGVIPYAAFGILSGVINSAGNVYLFDQYPTESYISYGKIGYDRLAKTKIEEVHLHFKSVCTGYVKVETALEGKALSAGLSIQTNYLNAMNHSIYGAYPGQWYNIEIGGMFDIQYLEYRGFSNGRR